MTTKKKWAYQFELSETIRKRKKTSIKESSNIRELQLVPIDPLQSKNYYFNREFNERVSQQPKIFPNEQNRIIMLFVLLVLVRVKTFSAMYY